MKTKLGNIGTLFALLFLSMVVAGCGAPEKANKQSELVTAVFDAREAEVGSKVANMLIKEMDVSQLEEDGEMYFAVVKFSGEVTLKGKLTFFEDSNEGWGYGNYFSPDIESANHIPTLDINPTRNGFTLVDDEHKLLEQLMLTGKTYEVEITIKDYEIYETGKGQENVAKLLEINKSEKIE